MIFTDATTTAAFVARVMGFFHRVTSFWQKIVYQVTSNQKLSFITGTLDFYKLHA